MKKAMDRVVDAIDVETFLYCKSEDEGKALAEALAQELKSAASGYRIPGVQGLGCPGAHPQLYPSSWRSLPLDGNGG